MPSTLRTFLVALAVLAGLAVLVLLGALAHQAQAEHPDVCLTPTHPAICYFEGGSR